MQTICLKSTSLTLLDDAHALVAGLFSAIARIAMAPIDRIARASDVAGVLPDYGTRDRRTAFGLPFSFRNLNHLS